MTCDRAAMMQKIHSHGWNAYMTFGCNGPVVIVRGAFPGFIEMPLPVRMDDDHTQPLDNIYALVSEVMPYYGRMGHA